MSGERSSSASRGTAQPSALAGRELLEPARLGGEVEKAVAVAQLVGVRRPRAGRRPGSMPSSAAVQGGAARRASPARSRQTGSITASRRSRIAGQRSLETAFEALGPGGVEGFVAHGSEAGRREAAVVRSKRAGVDSAAATGPAARSQSSIAVCSRAMRPGGDADLLAVQGAGVGVGEGVDEVADRVLAHRAAVAGAGHQHAEAGEDRAAGSAPAWRRDRLCGRRCGLRVEHGLVGRHQAGRASRRSACRAAGARAASRPGRWCGRPCRPGPPASSARGLPPARRGRRTRPWARVPAG